jgi:hypothetical protein
MWVVCPSTLLQRVHPRPQVRQLRQQLLVFLFLDRKLILQLLDLL